jgi:hypothetical protein
MTKTITFTDPEWRLLMQWAGFEERKADTQRMMALPHSPQEASAEADQLLIQSIQDKLRSA